MSDKQDALDLFTDETTQDSTMKVAHRPFRSLRQVGNDPDNPKWELAPIGELRRVRHLGSKSERALTELEFAPYVLEDGDVEKSYALGNFKGQHVIDHAPLYRPLLDQGWKVETHTFTRGGARVATLLSYPERTLEDVIDWDRITFENANERNSHPAILIRADAKRGTSYQATAGFIRMICTNGLVSKYLDIGNVTFRHGTMSAERVSAEIKELADVTQELRSIRATFEGREFKPEAARWASHLLTEYPAIERYPKFIASFMTGIVRVLRTPDRIRQLGHEFNMIAEADQPFTVLDTLNAVTNVNQNFRTLYGLESISGSLLEMAEVGEYVFDAIRFTKAEAITENPDDIWSEEDEEV